MPDKRQRQNKLQATYEAIARDPSCSYEEDVKPSSQPSYERPSKRAKVDDVWVTIKLPGGRGLAFRQADLRTFESHLPGLKTYAETSCDGDMGRAMHCMDVDADMIPFVLATVKNGEPPEEPYNNRKIISSVLSKCGISHELRDILQSHGFPGSDIIP